MLRGLSYKTPTWYYRTKITFQWTHQWTHLGTLKSVNLKNFIGLHFSGPTLPTSKSSTVSPTRIYFTRGGISQTWRFLGRENIGNWLLLFRGKYYAKAKVSSPKTLTGVGFEPTTFGLILQRSTNWDIQS